MLAFLQKRWFLVSLVVLITGGLTVGAWGSDELAERLDRLFDSRTTTAVVAGVLFLMSFSLDSQHVAYAAAFWSGPKLVQFMVVDGQEGCHYDAILVPPRKESVIFDSPDQFHYMAQRGNAFYLVDERIA